MNCLKKLFGKKDPPPKKSVKLSHATNSNQPSQNTNLTKIDNQPRKKTAEKLWINTLDDGGSEYFSLKFWLDHKIDLTRDKFWADEIKKLKNKPLERLALALRNLPLPAAFQNAAVATRALIREKRKDQQRHEKELQLLYWLAAINSFTIPYSSVLEEPGYNVIESIPGRTISTLSFEYHVLGYEKLELLNKTDAKWLVEAWGAPITHFTLHELHLDIWNHYEDKLKADK